MMGKHKAHPYAQCAGAFDVNDAGRSALGSSTHVCSRYIKESLIYFISEFSLFFFQ